MIETLRLSERAKEQLLRLRRNTGIKNWNALCRWALCMSLADERAVGSARIVADSNVEMSWKVLTGEWGQVYLALLQRRCAIDGMPDDTVSLGQLLRRHVHRGIGMLSSDPDLQDIESLCRRAIAIDK